MNATQLRQSALALADHIDQIREGALSDGGWREIDALVAELRADPASPAELSQEPETGQRASSVARTLALATKKLFGGPVRSCSLFPEMERCADEILSQNTQGDAAEALARATKQLLTAPTLPYDKFAEMERCADEILGHQAQPEQFMVVSRWCPADVESVRPNWSEDQCRRALEDIADDLKDQLTIAGNSLIDTLLPAGE